jgi:hypothetical protein
VVYKIISKVIANRLKPLLPTLISQERAGFVEGRQIMDNIIHAHEIIHTLKIHRRGEVIIQLDLAKAYDKAETGTDQDFERSDGKLKKWKFQPI